MRLPTVGINLVYYRDRFKGGHYFAIVFKKPQNNLALSMPISRRLSICFCNYFQDQSVFWLETPVLIAFSKKVGLTASNRIASNCSTLREI